jgi:hypothetical protein
MTQRYLALLLTACCISGIPSAASAGIISSFLTFDGPVHHTTNAFGQPFQGGGEDKLDDESRARHIDLGPAGFSAGDIIFGMISISDIDSSNAPNADIGQTEQIALVYSLKIGGAAGTVYAPGSVIPLVAVGDVLNAYDLRNLLHLDISGAAGLNDSSVFVAVTTPTGTMEGGVSPLNFDKASAELEVKEFNSSNSFGNAWSWEVTGGLVSGTDFVEFNFAPQGSTIGTQFGGFTIQKHDFGSGIIFLPVDVAHTSPGTVTTHDVVLSIATVETTGDAPWDFADQSQFLINATPEPASMVVWGGLATIGLCVTAARRRRAK